MRRVVLVLLGCVVIAGVLAAVSSGHAARRHAAPARVAHAQRDARKVPPSLLAMLKTLRSLPTPRRDCSFDSGGCACTVPVTVATAVAVAERPALPRIPGDPCQSSKSDSPCMLLVAGAVVSSSTPRAFCKQQQSLAPLVRSFPHRLRSLPRR